MLDIIYKKPFTTSLENNKNRLLLCEVKKIINSLAQSKELPKKYKSNLLNQNSKIIQEVQLRHDDLFLYYSISENNILILLDINSHEKIFDQQD